MLRIDYLTLVFGLLNILLYIGITWIVIKHMKKYDLFVLVIIALLIGSIFLNNLRSRGSIYEEAPFYKIYYI